MSELVSRAQADAVFGIGLPVLTLGVAGVLWKKQRSWAQLLATVGVLTAALWWTFNGILDRTGTDSIAGIALMAGLFVVAGIGLGGVLRRIE